MKRNRSKRSLKHQAGFFLAVLAVGFYLPGAGDLLWADCVAYTFAMNWNEGLSQARVAMVDLKADFRVWNGVTPPCHPNDPQRITVQECHGFINPQKQGDSCWVHSEEDDRYARDPIRIFINLYAGGQKLLNEYSLSLTHGNKVSMRDCDGGYLCVDCGDWHWRSPNPLWIFRHDPNQWVNQLPADTIRDARGQLACAPLDRNGVGRAFKDENGNWHCQFGFDGHEHTYDRNFLFLKVDPRTAQWKPGLQPNSIGSPHPDNPVCRANPGGGWKDMEFGWVYQEGCVLGWGGQSPTIRQYETLVVGQ